MPTGVDLDVALAIRGFEPTTHGDRVQTGDIVATKPVSGVRLEHARYGEVGRGEVSQFLWLRLTSPVRRLEETDWTAVVRNPADERVVWEKRRYCIPFHQLSQRVPGLDLARVADPSDAYQPLMGGVDRDQDYTPHTFDSARSVLIGEGHSPSEASAVLAPFEAQLRARPGWQERRDAPKLGHAMIHRLDDGTWTLYDPQRQTGGHILGRPILFAVEGLVYDKVTGAYVG